MRQVGELACIRCGASYPPDMVIDSRGCPRCFDLGTPSNLRAICDLGDEPLAAEADKPSSLWRYASMLPCSREAAISLGEGLTPLLWAGALGDRYGMTQLYIKDEGRNPTWSHKDRFSTMAVSLAQQRGCEVMATASSGNAGASLAAYTARAGMGCVVVTFAGTAGPMLAQIKKYGARIVTLPDKKDRWPFLTRGVRQHGWVATSPFHAPVVGSHPLGIAGYKTIAYEIVDQMGGQVPDWCILPVCYGDALIGLWDGFQDLFRLKRIDRLPRLAAAEIYGSLATALESKIDLIPDMQSGFEALAVSIGTTRSTFQALSVLRESGGCSVAVGNDGLISMQETLAKVEGLFVELAAATPFVALADLRQRNVIKATDKVVALATASGLKDLDRSSPEFAASQDVFQTADAAWHQLTQETDYCRPGGRWSR